MGTQPEVDNYDPTVYEIETTDPVSGGPGGIINMPLLNLTNRTAWLYGQVTQLSSNLAGFAPLASPAFTGSPTTPTPPVGDNSQNIPSTAFVCRALSGVVEQNVGGGVNVALAAATWGYGTIVFTGTITANISAIFPGQAGAWLVMNATEGDFALSCTTADGTGVTIPQGKSASIWGDGVNIYMSETAASAYGAVGSYFLASANGMNFVPGQTYPGADIGQAGTWQNMGGLLFLRMS